MRIVFELFLTTEKHLFFIWEQNCRVLTYILILKEQIDLSHLKIPKFPNYTENFF